MEMLITMDLLKEINQKLDFIIEEENNRPKEQPIYNTKEASNYLRVSEDVIRDLAKEGKIQHRKKKGKGYLFRKEWLDKFFDNGFNY